MRLGQFVVLCALATCVGLLDPPTTSANPLPQQNETSCTIQAGGAIDVVLLVDQSKSLAPRLSDNREGPRSDELLRQLSAGLGKVAETLELVVDDGVSVSLGVIEFSTDTRISRPLSRFSNQTEMISVQREVTETDDLGNFTDYARALEAAAAMFQTSLTDADCRILVWFTDGVAEPIAYQSEDTNVRNNDYVRRTVNELRSAVCGAPGVVPIAGTLHRLGVVTYALMISDKVERWLTLEPESTDSLSASEAARFTASLDAMRAVTGDREPELGGVSAPKISAECEPFLSSGNEGPQIAGQVVAESGKLAEYLFFAIGGPLNPGQVGECPNEITQSDGGWTSGVLPPGPKFARIAVIVLNGDLQDPTSVQIIAEGQSTAIALEPSGYLRQSELSQIKGPWQLRLEPSAQSESLRFCVQYKLNPLNTKQIVLSPVEPGLSDSGAAIGESTIEFSIDWSELQELDGLDASTYLENVEIDSPVGPIRVSPDFSRATLDVASMPDALEASIQQYLSDQFTVMLTPASDLEEQHVIGALVSPNIPLRNNENAPALTCEGDTDLTERGESDGKQRISQRSCIVTPPLSGSARVTLRGITPENDESISWTPVGDDFQTLPDSITLSPDDEPITVRFATQELDKSRYWADSGAGEIALTWSENNMLSTDESRFSIDLLPPPNIGTAWALVAAFMVGAAVMSLLLLWLIGRALIRLPKGSEFYFRECVVEVNSSTNGPRPNAAGDLEQAFKVAKTNAVRDSKNRSSISFGPYTLTRRLPIWPPFAAPDIAVEPSGTICAVPAGSNTKSVAVQFDSVLIARIQDPSPLLTGGKVTLRAHLVYRARSSNALSLLTTRPQVINSAVSAFLSATTTQLHGAEKNKQVKTQQDLTSSQRLRSATGSFTPGRDPETEVQPLASDNKPRGRGKPVDPQTPTETSTPPAPRGRGRTGPKRPPGNGATRGRGRSRPSS